MLGNRWSGHGAPVLLAALVGLVIACGVDVRLTHSQTDEAAAVRAQYEKLYQEGRYSEAIPLAQQLLAIREKALGANNSDVAGALNDLAGLYGRQGRYAEAEPLYKRALAIREKALGPNHADVATSLDNLAELYRVQGRYAEVEPLYKRALAIREKAPAPNHPDVVTALNNLAWLYEAQDRYADAEPLYQRALAIKEKALGPNHAEVATALNNLASVYETLGRHADAEPLKKRALVIKKAEQEFSGFNSKNKTELLYLKYNSLNLDGLYSEALPYAQEYLAALEKESGDDDPKVRFALRNLGNLLEKLGRYAEAELLFKRALASAKKSHGPDSVNVGLAEGSLGHLYILQGRYAEAVPFLEQQLTAFEKAFGPNHTDVANAINSLAMLNRYLRNYPEAEALYKRARLIYNKNNNFGEDYSKNSAAILYNLGALYLDQGRYGEAEAHFGKALVIERQALGPDHPSLAKTLDSVAVVYTYQHRWLEALPFVREAMKHGHPKRTTHLAVLLGARFAKSLTQDAATAESFIVVQRAASSAASAALNQLAVRLASGTDELAQLVRKDQDLAAEHERLDKDLLAAFSKAPSQRDAKREAAIRNRRKEIVASRAEIGDTLVQRFPDYAALSKPQPMAVSDVSSLLNNDEALVLVDLGKEKNEASYIWVVDRSGAVWKRFDTKPKGLEQKITDLRASLEPDSDKPFDAELAYELYKVILGPVEDRIAKKRRLLMVMNGALTSVPPQVLVTSNPANTKSPDWLIRRHAIAILPSVYSLKILRGKNAKSSAPKPLIGFGDPVFGKGDPKFKTRRIATKRGYAGFFRVGTADVDLLARALPSLPDTAIELRAVAKSLGASAADLKLGSAATVTSVKQSPLDRYRIVYFATHALVSGETAQAAKGQAEPALVLSLPERPTPFDDGLLTASEVAQLKLNADWVVLSACNTAAAEKPGAEALSGLARAFFYAGARALLVSHWPVESDLAAKLMTMLFAEIGRDPELTTAEALREAMLSIMNDRSHSDWANPSSWAPFILVGDGGLIRRRGALGR